MTLSRNPLKPLFLALMLGAGASQAADFAAPADLPPTAVVTQSLMALPAVRAAQAELRAAAAESRQLQAGEYEYSVGLGMTRRNVSGGADSNDWQASLQRGLRLPGKRQLDARIGGQLVAEAEERVGDARHESARQLLGLWYGALQAQREVALWQKQAELLAEEQRIVALRVKRGDAARLDSLQADAALAQARSQVRQAESRAAAAVAELRQRFPELPAPNAEAALPALPPGDEAAWIEHTLEHNHELLAVQRASERARLQTQRAERDRTPDPSIGLHVGSEQRGDERLIGVSLNIPLSGQGRKARAERHLALAEASSEMEAGVRRRLAAEAAANWQRASAGVEGYQRLEEAATAMERHADLAGRAHEMGELGLSDTLLARRNALDARLQAEQARLAANEAIARLLLDAHQLWPLAEHDDAHH
ncbi:MAG: TolC family protein [Pseudomonadota bacterium]